MVASPRREGYALLAVLWVCVAVTALVGLLAAAARTAVAASRNRMAEHALVARARQQRHRKEIVPLAQPADVLVRGRAIVELEQ